MSEMESPPGGISEEELLAKLEEQNRLVSHFVLFVYVVIFPNRRSVNYIVPLLACRFYTIFSFNNSLSCLGEFQSVNHHTHLLDHCNFVRGVCNGVQGRFTDT